MQTTNWIEIKWHLKDKTLSEELCGSLQLYNSLGSFEKMEIEKDDESKRKTATVLSYFSDGNLEALKDSLKTLETPQIEIQDIQRIPQADWATNWKKYFKPFYLTKNIVIKPSWETYQKKENDLVITIDPGMAFGTGQHDTPKFCAQFLAELKTNQPQLQTVYDVGCGSGILSFIAKKVGYESIIGFDNDKYSVENSFENLERNPDLQNIDFFVSTGSVQNQNLKPRDVVVSNIIAEALVDLKDDIFSLIKSGGYLILSGIIPDRAHLILEAYQDLELIEEKSSGEWNAYLYRKK